MKIPVTYKENGKDITVGRVESYNEETGEATIKLDEEYESYFKAMITEQVPISVSCRHEAAIKNDVIENKALSGVHINDGEENE